ncbi:histidine phosphatase family protein [Acetivibrio ethanolgignens]|uniref:Phosphoglycerate mutase n=1 Tax=Acetivibrio ethanolgignens TaxID=290052 RepID=A0A0V8QFH5_9FIRM|nr:histidine phosphatase family protein [Acetivibrio ethanolgignens]KSV59355.1 hypothetical protein ASU35_09355 [Acetivibrio ethanolgignens]
MWNQPENQIKLVFIRHGATESNKEQRYLGREDEPLSREGKKELLRLKEKGCYQQIDYLFTSPMKRCLESARLLYPDKEAVIIPEWKEIDFGVFEGKNYRELKGDMRYQTWLESNGTLPFPEGESQEAFKLRSGCGFQRMLKELSTLTKENQNSSKTVGMVVHGGTIMAVLNKYCGGQYFDYQVSNGGGYTATLAGCLEEPAIVELRRMRL